mgnify:CR=1 FL=1
MSFFALKRILRSQIMRHSTWMAAGGIIQLVVAFTANLVLVRFIEPEGFGRYAIAIASITLIMTFFSLRVGVLIIRTEEHAFNDEKKTLYFNVIFQELIVAGVMSFCVLSVSRLLDWWSGLLLIAVLIGQFADNNKIFFERQMPYKRLSVLEAGVNGGGHLLSVGVVLLGGHMAALYLRELFYGIATLVSLRMIGRITWRRLRFVRIEEWKEILRGVRGAWFDMTFDSSFSRIIMILAGYVGGEKGAGYLFQAYRLAGIPHQFLAPLATRISFNWFSRQDNHARRYNGLRTLITYMSVPLLLAVTVVYMYADRLVPFLFGDAWAHAAQLLVSLSGYVMFLSLFDLLRVYMLATDQTRNLVVMRAAQYLGVAAATVPYLMVSGTITETTLGAGVSLAYALAFVIGVWLIRVHNHINERQRVAW